MRREIQIFLERASDSRTVTVTFSSEEPCDRGEYIEILSHRDGDVALHRLTDGGAVLFNHDVNRVIGVVEKAWIETKDGRRVGRAQIRFSRNSFADSIYQEVKDGVMGKVSVGYVQTKIVASKRGPGGRPINTYAWEPNEISVVSVPMDVTVGVDRGREIELLTRNFMKKNSPFDRLAAAYLGEDESPSLADSVRALVTGKPNSDVEASSRSCLESMGTLPGTGMGVAGYLYVPFRTLQRDLSAGIMGQGGAFIGDDKQPFIFPFQNITVAGRCGATIITGIKGNGFVPRFTAPPQATWATESATVNDSTPATDQFRVVPHRCTAVCNITSQLELQGPGTTAALARLILSKLAVEVDKKFLFGAGGVEPVGIFNTDGIGTTVFGGAATYSKVLDLEQALTDANVECQSAWYVTSPKSKTKLKKIAKDATITEPIWETIQGKDYCNGFPALATNQMGENNQLGFADFAQTALVFFGDGIELQYNPYSGDKDGKVRIVAHAWVDVLVNFNKAIALSADAANQ